MFIISFLCQRKDAEIKDWAGSPLQCVTFKLQTLTLVDTQVQLPIGTSAELQATTTYYLQYTKFTRGVR